jgi:vacuolar-type H+-ATPase subunit I/STV1
MTDRYKESIQGARDCVERNKDGGVYLPDLLVVIDSQQAEIERLKHEREVLIEDIHHSADQINEQFEEIERLQNFLTINAIDVSPVTKPKQSKSV